MQFPLTKIKVLIVQMLDFMGVKFNHQSSLNFYIKTGLQDYA